MKKTTGLILYTDFIYQKLKEILWKDKVGQERIFQCMGEEYPFSLEMLGEHLERLREQSCEVMTDKYIFSNEVLFDAITATQGYRDLACQTINPKVDQEIKNYINKTCEILEKAVEQRQVTLFEYAIRNLLFLGTNISWQRRKDNIILEKFNIGFSSMRLICEEALEQIMKSVEFTARDFIRYVDYIDGLPRKRQAWEEEIVDGERSFFGLLPKTRNVLRDQPATENDCRDAILIYSFGITAVVFNLEARRYA